MKRITALLLAVLCMLSVCACNNGSKAADVFGKRPHRGNDEFRKARERRYALRL